MKKREVMQQALDALEEYEHHTDDPTGIAVAALRAELAKPEPEPVAWTYPTTFKRLSYLNGSSDFIWNNSHASDMIPLYRKENV